MESDVLTAVAMFIAAAFFNIAVKKSRTAVGMPSGNDGNDCALGAHHG
jgi:recombinational DNA repair protein RecR